MAGRSGDAGVSVLARASLLLRAFSEDTPELTLAQLTARTGLARSTAHRLASELVEHGLLEKTASGYAVGTSLWEIGQLALVGIRLRELAMPHLISLYQATGENVHLATLDGFDALYIARLTGEGSVPTLSRTGGRLPLHTTGVGKALLATRSDEWLEQYFRRPREKETLHSVTDEGALRAEIARNRELGYATTRQEMTLGNVSIAVALPAIEGLPPTAVGVVTHLTRGDEQRLAPMIIRSAQDIARAVSHWTG